MYVKASVHETHISLSNPVTSGHKEKSGAPKARKATIKTETTLCSFSKSRAISF